MLQRTSRVPYIDGLRACAVIGVICCHSALLMPAWGNIAATSTGIPWYWLGHALVDGAHGVDLFFVLSGFCLSYPTLARIHREGSAPFDLVRFATHRFVRIFPPYVLSIVVFAAFGLAIFAHSGTFEFPEAGHVSALDVARQILFLDRGTTMVNSNFWTLAVEFRWYFIFPACLALWLWGGRIYLVAILAVVVLYAQTRVYNIDLGVLPAFLLGIVAADIQIRDLPIRRYALLLTPVALVAAILTERFSSMPGPDGSVYRSFYLQSDFAWHLTAFFFVIAAGENPLLKRVLSNSALVFVGIASYSIYLMHAPLMFLTAPHLGHVRPAIAFFVLLGVGLFAGMCFWWAVERWFTEGTSRARWHARVYPYVHAAVTWLRIPAVLHLSHREITPTEASTSEQRVATSGRKAPPEVLVSP
jgi:peptidoglycan/LPS O-acetylase OafA/YrhL